MRIVDLELGPSSRTGKKRNTAGTHKPTGRQPLATTLAKLLAKKEVRELDLKSRPNLTGAAETEREIRAKIKSLKALALLDDKVITDPYFVLHKFGRPYESDDFGRTRYIEIPGCMWRCAWCYVPRFNLSAKIDTPEMLEYRKGRMPKEFNGQARVWAKDIFDYLYQLEKGGDKLPEDPMRSICIGSGEPLTNLAAIIDLATRTKNAGTPWNIEVDTTGIPIILKPHLLNKLEGLEDVLRFRVSMLKGRNPIEHKRNVGSNDKYADGRSNWDYGFNSANFLLSKGFWALPAVMANTIAYPPESLREDPRYSTERSDGNGGRIRVFKDECYDQFAERTAEWLHDRMTEVHPEFPRLLVMDTITRGNNIEEYKALERQIKAAGFTNTKPKKFMDTVKRVFAERNTPLIERSKEKPIIDNPEFVELMEKIVREKSKKPSFKYTRFQECNDTVT